MDVAALFVTTQTIQITNPADGSAIGISVELASPDSPQVMAVQRKWQDRLLSKQGRKLTADEMHEQVLDLLAAGVVSWTWADGVTFKGEVPGSDLKSIKAVLSDPAGAFIARQIDGALANEAGFFKG